MREAVIERKNEPMKFALGSRFFFSKKKLRIFYKNNGIYTFCNFKNLLSFNKKKLDDVSFAHTLCHFPIQSSVDHLGIVMCAVYPMQDDTLVL